jgi:hypothetical protein
MTAKIILLALAAGLVSAIVFASAAAGPLLPRMILILLTPFPLYLAGLGLGVMPAVIASAAGTLLIFGVLPSVPSYALAFAATQALPAIMLTRLTLTSQENAGGERVWYPVGRLLVAIALLSGAFAFVYLLSQGADTEALTKSVRALVDDLKGWLPAMPDGQPLGEEQLKDLTSMIVSGIPGGIALSVMATALASLWLAGRVALAAQQLPRPWPDFTRIELPLGSAIVLLAATLISFTSDKAWLLADGLASALRFAFALVGLAVIHYVTKESAWRGFILTAVYASLLVLSKHTLLILTLIGLAEAVFHYRYAAQRKPPPAA